MQELNNISVPISLTITNKTKEIKKKVLVINDDHKFQSDLEYSCDSLNIGSYSRFLRLLSGERENRIKIGIIYLESMNADFWHCEGENGITINQEGLDGKVEGKKICVTLDPYQNLKTVRAIRLPFYLLNQTQIVIDYFPAETELTLRFYPVDMSKPKEEKPNWLKKIRAKLQQLKIK